MRVINNNEMLSLPTTYYTNTYIINIRNYLNSNARRLEFNYVIFFYAALTFTPLELQYAVIFTSGAFYVFSRENRRSIRWIELDCSWENTRKLPSISSANPSQVYSFNFHKSDPS